MAANGGPFCQCQSVCESFLTFNDYSELGKESVRRHLALPRNNLYWINGWIALLPCAFCQRQKCIDVFARPYYAWDGSVLEGRQYQYKLLLASVRYYYSVYRRPLCQRYHLNAVLDWIYSTFCSRVSVLVLFNVGWWVLTANLWAIQWPLLVWSLKTNLSPCVLYGKGHKVLFGRHCVECEMYAEHFLLWELCVKDWFFMYPRGCLKHSTLFGP